MIIRRYILREIGTTLLAVTSVLLLIFFSTRFVRLLGDVAEGRLPAELVFSVLGLELLKNLASILPLAVFFAVLLAFGRLYRDQEMVALNASGIGQAQIMRMLLLLTPFILVLNGYLALYAAPWAAERVEQIRHAAEYRSELSLLSAGRFTESKDGRLIMYVESLTDDKQQLKNVFVQRLGTGSKSVLASDTGYRYVDKNSGDEFMVMVDGYRYEGEPGKADYRITKFDKHAVRINEKKAPLAIAGRNATASADLWQSANLREQAELQSRIILPLSAVAFMILAVPMSRVKPREGRYGRLFSAVVIYVIYNNLIGTSYKWVGKGEISPWIGMWWLPLLLLLTAAVVVAWQVRGQSLWHGLLRKPLTGTKA
ncbi:LPS export ABC transporter permease LptF [Sulfuriflexus mobilis]|uniref:LPS export ABC transporter permease LptF n=1 Tax=Sulfuriflexus mobilis TaxID=1811807 RepID=UPI000F834E16|nr:LPS export ABC transporter permease LptF [Sulfuriflexus mobilis]